MQVDYDVEEVLKLFPAPAFRPYQREALEQVVEHLNSGVRCILLDCPTRKKTLKNKTKQEKRQTSWKSSIA